MPRAVDAATDRVVERLPFFWRLAFKRSTLVDIETTGLDPTQGHGFLHPSKYPIPFSIIPLTPERIHLCTGK